ncbi:MULTISPECIES: helix-turn-helix domain-containing protein [unclassified Lonepinella]|uniref:helix-turn-helix domain-containing protein n=1 Tax=unclassified Lonepinella TaxID=2642006 RepID=UPI003F6DAB5B
MQTETYEFVTLAELEQELMQDPEFVELRQARDVQKKMIEELRQYRLNQHLSQGEIAKRTGIKAQNISRLERGLVRPTLETITRYAQALGGSIVFQPNA